MRFEYNYDPKPLIVRMQAQAFFQMQRFKPHSCSELLKRLSVRTGFTESECIQKIKELAR